METLSPWIMGILNVTPDSFSDGGKYLSPEKAIRHGIDLAKDGADIIDVGGESTRPGASPVALQEEMDRVLPVLEKLLKETSVRVSVDTTKYELAREAVRLGAVIINDISGGQDARLLSLLKDNPHVQLILMHCQGDPKTMQLNPSYPLGAVSEVKESLAVKVRRFEEGGISLPRIWIDPGIGFGKTANHNLDLLRHLDVLVGVGGRVVIGTSRKSFLGMLMNDSQSPLETRDAGTLASNLWAFQKGASVFRVHDVGQMKRALKTWEAVRYGSF